VDQKHSKQKFYETEAFKELEIKWKKRLERSGFDDIEYEGGCLKKPACGLFITKSNGRDYKLRKVHYDSVEDYYRLAGQFLYDYTFANSKEKLIWKLHAEGISQRNIVIALSKKGIHTYKLQVHNLLQMLENEMINKCKSTKI
jgi:hypothetical protein